MIRKNHQLNHKYSDNRCAEIEFEWKLYAHYNGDRQQRVSGKDRANDDNEGVPAGPAYTIGKQLSHDGEIYDAEQRSENQTLPDGSVPRRDSEKPHDNGCYNRPGTKFFLSLS
jgi:hypothetical protein